MRLTKSYRSRLSKDRDQECEESGEFKWWRDKVRTTWLQYNQMESFKIEFSRIVSGPQYEEFI
jgi:hypothetical protein